MLFSFPPNRRGARRAFAVAAILSLALSHAPVRAQQSNPPGAGQQQPPQGMGVSTGTALVSATRRTVGIVDPKAPKVFEDVTTRTALAQFKHRSGGPQKDYIIECVSGGVAIFDYDNDGFVDVFVTALSNETYPLFRNNGDMTFAYATSSAGVSLITIPYSGWGTRFCDFDSDGLRDIFVAQGHVLDTIEKTTGFLTYKQTPLLMRNNGKGFVNVSASAGLNVPLAARGAAFGDIDNDGDTDVVLAETDGPPVILRNNGTKNHWLGLALVGAKGNRQSLGARLTVTDSAGGRQIFDVTAAGSYLSSNDPRVVVGLGSKTGVRSVEVRWPDGRTQTVSNPQIDRYVTINEK